MRVGRWRVQIRRLQALGNCISGRCSVEVLLHADRNHEYAVSRSHHPTLSRRPGETNSGGEERGMVSLQQRVTGGGYKDCSRCVGCGIRQRRIEVGKPVVRLAESSLEVIPDPQVDSQIAGDVIVVLGRNRRTPCAERGWVGRKRIRVRQPQQKVGVSLSAEQTGEPEVAGTPGHQRIVLILVELAPQFERMAAFDPGEIVGIRKHRLRARRRFFPAPDWSGTAPLMVMVGK